MLITSLIILYILTGFFTICANNYPGVKTGNLPTAISFCFYFMHFEALLCLWSHNNHFSKTHKRNAGLSYVSRFPEKKSSLSEW